MEETRHLASWVGGQEALHDRVLTLEEALEEVAAIGPADVQRVARTCSTTIGSDWSSSPRAAPAERSSDP